MLVASAFEIVLQQGLHLSERLLDLILESSADSEVLVLSLLIVHLLVEESNVSDDY